MQHKQSLTVPANRANVAVMSERNRLPETIPAFRVTADVYAVIKDITAQDRRTISDVARLLLERGVAAYRRDRKLFEEAAEDDTTEEPPARDTRTSRACPNCGTKTTDVACPDCGRPLVDAALLSRADLDALPFGVVRMDADGTIISFNKTERELSRVGHKRMIGRNFFEEIAPCANVRAFRGKFEKFLAGKKKSEEFEYTYDFRSGAVHVRLIFFKESDQIGYVLSSKVEAGGDRKTG
jgi:photoactive yellow protein